MKQMKTLGKWLFIIPFAAFGLLHFGPLEYSLSYVPACLPFPALWVYATGACLLGFTLSAILRRYDGIASLLLAILMLVFVGSIHLPKAFTGDFWGIIATFRDTCMAGAALLYSTSMATDTRYLGFESGKK